MDCVLPSTVRCPSLVPPPLAADVALRMPLRGGMRDRLAFDAPFWRCQLALRKNSSCMVSSHVYYGRNSAVLSDLHVYYGRNAAALWAWHCRPPAARSPSVPRKFPVRFACGTKTPCATLLIGRLAGCMLGCILLVEDACPGLTLLVKGEYGRVRACIARDDVCGDEAGKGVLPAVRSGELSRLPAGCSTRARRGFDGTASALDGRKGSEVGERRWAGGSIGGGGIQAGQEYGRRAEDIDMMRLRAGEALARPRPPQAGGRASHAAHAHPRPTSFFASVRGKPTFIR